MDIRAIENPGWEQRQEDIVRAYPKASINWVNLKALGFHVKQSLAHYSLSKRLQVEQQNTTFLLKGICVEAECELLKEDLQIVASNNPDAILVNDVTPIHPNITIVSTSISAKAASVTLRRGNKMIVVQEGGKVFDLGTLSLITPSGITIANPYGPIFIAWRR